MKAVNSLVFCLIAAAASAVSIAAQAPVSNVKVMFINTEAFGVQGGITKYVTAITNINAGFNGPREQIRTMLARHDNLARDVTQLQKQIEAAPNAAGTPALIKQLDAKVEEGRTLETEIKRRQEDNKASFERQYSVTVSPILEDIRRALQEYAKQRGYTVILDVSKLGAALVAFDEKADITKDFVAFYNARQAPAAARPAGTP